MSRTLRNTETALLAWAEEASGRGFPVPSTENLTEIAGQHGGWDPMTPVEAAWKPTIDHIVTQSRFGVLPTAVLGMLPDELRTPTGLEPVADPAARPAAAKDDLETRIIDALIEWRAAQVKAGVPGAGDIRDVTLRRLVKGNRVTAEEIGRLLGGTAGALANEIAAVIARVSRSVVAAPEPEPLPPPPPFAPPSVPERPRAPESARVRDSNSGSANPPPTPDEKGSAAGRHSRGPGDTGRSAATGGRGAAGAPEDIGAPGVAGGLTHADFAEFAFGEEEFEPKPIAVTQSGELTELRWPELPADDGVVVIYRLVAGDEGPPYKPEAGELLAAGPSVRFVDGRYLTTAARYYQVWCHVGENPAAARDAQPVKWATGEAVSPVEDFALYEEDGRVIGRWGARLGTRSVQVMRRVIDGGPGGTVQIAAGETCLTGFVDPDPPRGRRFLYQASAEIEVGTSTRLAPPVQEELLVSVALTPVDDLRAVSSDESSFDLEWTTPGEGQKVDIYRFREPPQAGLDQEDRDMSSLTNEGFTEDTRIKDPIRMVDAVTSQIVGVRWPAEWDRAYLVPVTSFNGRVRVGRTEIRTKQIPAVTDPRIVERLSTQLIVFGWPDGAAAVQIYVGLSSVPTDQICSAAPLAEVNRSRFERDGAVILQRPLQNQGCTVCVVPVAYSAGEQLRGEISTIQYRGLWPLRYTLRAPMPQEGMPPPQYRQIALSSASDLGQPLTLMAVGNPERLPLDPHDGRTLRFLHRSSPQPLPHAQLPQIRRSDQPLPIPYALDVSDVYGYVRLFVHQTGDAADGRPQFALQDPPLEQLYVDYPAVPGSHG